MTVIIDWKLAQEFAGIKGSSFLMYIQHRIVRFIYVYECAEEKYTDIK